MADGLRSAAQRLSEMDGAPLAVDEEALDILAHGCGGLLCHHIFGAGNLQLAHAKAGCAGRYNNQLVPGVFDVAPHFYQCFGVADVQPPARMGQRAGADLDNNAHQFFPISLVLS